MDQVSDGLSMEEVVKQFKPTVPLALAAQPRTPPCNYTP